MTETRHSYRERKAVGGWGKVKTKGRRRRQTVHSNEPIALRPLPFKNGETYVCTMLNFRIHSVLMVFTARADFSPLLIMRRNRLVEDEAGDECASSHTTLEETAEETIFRY